MVQQKFNADYMGSFLPQDTWGGKVLSTYSKAVNLLHPSGILISIVSDIGQMTDFGLTVSNFSLFLTSVSPGSQFLWKDQRIVFSDMIVDLSEASVWSGAIVPIFIEVGPVIMKIKKVFNELAVTEGLSPIITKETGNPYSKTAERLIKKAVETANISGGLLIDLSFLVGMGIGFTPSGDDFLTGVMLYEFIFGFKLINRENIRAKLSGTTVGGRTLLILALSNSFPFYLKQFAESIFVDNKSSEDIVKRVIMHGSTSGSDALTGFIWALEKNEKSGLIKLT